MRTTRPQVALIAYTQFVHPETYFADVEQSWETDATHDAQKLIEFAGRICYESWRNPSGRSNEAYIENIKGHGHFSVVEHASASFVIWGVSRDFSHECVRHRHFSYSQRSQRFVNEAGSRVFPGEAFADDDRALEIAARVVDTAQAGYEELYQYFYHEKFAGIEDKVRRRKMARQSARRVLPGMTETALVMTGNLRAWRHFFKMRCSEHADAEIRQVALLILDRCRELAPAVFSDFHDYDHPQAGRCAATDNPFA